MINFLMIMGGLIVTNLYTWYVASKLATEDVSFTIFKIVSAISLYEEKNGMLHGTILKEGGIEVEIEEC